MLDEILNAIRIWRRRPMLAFVAILTFALGAGANLAVFQLVWRVVLRPLPYTEPGGIMQVWQDDGSDARKTSRKEAIELWRTANRSFTALANFRQWQITVGGGGNPEIVRTGLVSAEFFDMLGVSMYAGRAFTPDEIRTGSDRALILTHGYWQRRFSSDREILGRALNADGEVCQVVGILPPDFRGAIIGGVNEPEVYMPISRAISGVYKLPTSFVAGRLKLGVTREQAQADLAALLQTLPRPNNAPPARLWLSPLPDEIGLSLRPAMIALFGATLCVLLIACFNIANLLLAHTAARQREMAVRAALGARRGQLIRQLLTESIVLTTAGAAAAIAAAAAFSSVFTALYPAGLPRADEPGGNWVAIAAAALLALGCGVAVGLIPAWRVTGGRRMEDWLRVGRGFMARGGRRWADSLVAAQVMLTVAVIIAAGLLLKSFEQLRGADPGFRKDHVITAAIALPSAVYGQRPAQARFAETLTARLTHLPGVVAAGLTNSLPMRYTVLTDILFRLPGEPEQLSAGRGVSGSYFQAMGLQMAQGRPLTAEDDGRKGVAVVNEAFVRRFLAGREAIGTQFEPEGARIVGVVRDVRHRGLQQAAPPEMYFPLSNLPSAAIGIAIRSPASQAEITAALRRELRAIDPQLALEKIMTLEEVLDGDLARPRFQALLLALFAAIALSLAAVGAYGVVAQNLRARTQEFGVRRAVGAQTHDILALVTRQGMRAPLVGLMLGAAVAWAGAKYLAALLYSVNPDDPIVWGIALGMMALVCLAACAWAGRLAVRVQPSQALRNE